VAVTDQLYPPAALPQGKNAGVQWRGGWVGPRAGLHDLEKRKIPWLCRVSNPGSSSSSFVFIPTTLHRLSRIQVIAYIFALSIGEVDSSSQGLLKSLVFRLTVVLQNSVSSALKDNCLLSGLHSSKNTNLWFMERWSNIYSSDHMTDSTTAFLSIYRTDNTWLYTAVEIPKSLLVIIYLP
jgi:hypothetical protein